MPRVNIYFTDKTLAQLHKYTLEKHGPRRAISITVEQAVKEFLRRNSGESEFHQGQE